MMMMRMIVPLPLRATEAICPNNKKLLMMVMRIIIIMMMMMVTFIVYYHLIDCSPVAIYSRFGLIVRHRISPSCPSNPNKLND